MWQNVGSKTGYILAVIIDIGKYGDVRVCLTCRMTPPVRLLFVFRWQTLGVVIHYLFKILDNVFD